MKNKPCLKCDVVDHEVGLCECLCHETLETTVCQSSCCGVGVSVAGTGATQYYVCNKCDKACDFLLKPTITSLQTESKNQINKNPASERPKRVKNCSVSISRQFKPTESMEQWEKRVFIFIAYKNEGWGNIPFFSKLFDNHAELKTFSAEHSYDAGQKVKGYSSAYVDLTDKSFIHKVIESKDKEIEALKREIETLYAEKAGEDI